MALRRVFVDRIEGSEALATGRTAHHLARSARLRPGETVEVSDQSAAYRAITAGCSPTEVRFRIVEPLPAADPAVTLDAALAIIKFPRFDWAVEKLTEFGVRSVIPIVAARSDAKLVAAAGKRAERWRRIAFEAAQQARCLAAPTVKPPVSLDEFIESCGERLPHSWPCPGDRRCGPRRPGSRAHSLSAPRVAGRTRSSG